MRKMTMVQVVILCVCGEWVEKSMECVEGMKEVNCKVCGRRIGEVWIEGGYVGT